MVGEIDIPKAGDARTDSLDTSRSTLSLHAQELAIKSKARTPETLKDVGELEKQSINEAYTPIVDNPELTVLNLRSKDAKLTELSKNHWHLKQGCVFMAVKEETTVDTERGTVFIKPGSAVVIHTDNKDARVYNLLDKERDSVRLLIGGSTAYVGPGHELIFGPEKAIRKDVEPDSAAYKTLRVEPVPNTKLSIAVINFSPEDALKHCRVFKQLQKSGDPRNLKLLDKIIKTAAILQYIRRGAPPIQESVPHITPI